MLHFDGDVRSCIKFKLVKGVGQRCIKFQEGLKHPKCPSSLKGGGRSQNYIRGGWKCPASADASGYKHKGSKARRSRRAKR